ncbi:MAG TPA: sulfotransferase [Phycisphaerae bacterium]|nr:sulfotransferase [Phycisphaerae bacterium]
MLHRLKSFLRGNPYKRPRLTPWQPPARGENAGPPFEVTSIEMIDASPHIAGAHLDYPVAGYQGAEHQLEIGGWVFGGQFPATEVVLYDHQGIEILRTPCSIRRYDGAGKVSNAVEQNGGFWLPMSIVANQCELRYTLVAILGNGAHIPFANLVIKANTLCEYQSAIAPLLLTSLGRTGSTWVIGLLARHPQIIAIDPQHFDPRVATYWSGIIAGLAQPQSYMQMTTPGAMHSRGWWLGSPLSFKSNPPQDALLNYLHGTGVESIADFGLRQIEGLYQHLRSSQGRDAPRYYVEKFVPRIERLTLRNLCPGAREVVLVRDPRDVICSALAFNKKRGYQSFGREAVQSDEEYVRWFKGSVESLANLLDSSARPVHLLRYEEIVRSPREGLRGLCRFLELDGSDATIDYILKERSEEVLKDHRTTATPAESIGRWETDFTPAMRTAAREALDPLLLKLGYPATA